MLDLPEGFRSWSTEKRLDWHGERIRRETPVFDMLERAEIFTCFTAYEIKERLRKVRWWSQVVTNTIRMRTSSEFARIKQRLDDAVTEAKRIGRSRADLLTEVFHKEVPDYSERIEELGRCQEAILTEVNSRELELVQLCTNYQAPSEPYLVYDELKEKL